MCNYYFFTLTVAFQKNQKNLEPIRANKNTLRANFLLRVDYFFSKKIRKLNNSYGWKGLGDFYAYQSF